MSNDSVRIFLEKYRSHILVFIVAIIIGAGFGQRIFTLEGLQAMKVVSECDLHASYLAGYDAAKKEFRTASTSPLTIPSEIKSFVGTVESINADGFSLKVKVPLSLPNNKTGTLSVFVNKDTKITALKQKSKSLLGKELQDFSKNGASYVVPDPFTHEPIEYSRIIVGSMVSVATLNDIRDSQQIIAAEVSLMSDVK